MIIVCGADNTGKTTLVEHLTDKFKLSKIPRYHTMPPTDRHDWLDWVITHLQANDPARIADRFYVEEFVYGPIKRGSVLLTGPEQFFFDGLVAERRPLIILCQTDMKTISSTFGDREQYPNLNEIPVIMSQFRYVLGRYPFNSCPQAIHNFKKDPKFLTADVAVDVYLKTRGKM